MSVRYLVKELSGSLFIYKCTLCGYTTPPASPLLHTEQGMRMHIAVEHQDCGQCFGPL